MNYHIFNPKGILAFTFKHKAHIAISQMTAGYRGVPWSNGAEKAFEVNNYHMKRISWPL